MAVDLFAGSPVRDYEQAVAWYERLLGSEPSVLPHAAEAVWELAEHRFLFVVERPERAGHAIHTIFVHDLDATVSEIAARGIEPAERETYSNGVRKATYRDPDGNEIGLGGAPLAAAAEADVEEAPVSDTLADIPTAAVPYADARWQPIRNHFGLTAFGMNAYTGLRAGDRIIGEHDHSSPEDEQHQELYFVHSGRARFEVDGAVVDAPAGTFVSARDVATRRSAIAEEDNTVVLVVGAEPGAPFEITPAEREELSDAGLPVRPA